MIIGDTIVHEIEIHAPPEVVFTYFTDPDRHLRWLGRKANLDPRPDGVYEVEMNDTTTVIGHYKLVSPPSQIVFTWGFRDDDRIPPGSSTVTVTLTPSGGGTLVRLVHTGLPYPALASHEKGWTGYLADLVAVLA